MWVLVGARTLESLGVLLDKAVQENERFGLGLQKPAVKLPQVLLKSPVRTHTTTPFPSSDVIRGHSDTVTGDGPRRPGAVEGSYRGPLRS